MNIGVLCILSSDPSNYSRYASCLEYLQSLKPNLLLDIHLHDHIEALYTEIRHKAIIQYTHPFISVDLHTMADAFKTSVAGLEKELEALITENQIQVRYLVFTLLRAKFGPVLFSLSHYIVMFLLIDC